MLLTALGRLGVRWRLALTSTGVLGPSLGNPPVVVFSLGLGGVPGEGPVAGQCADPSHVARPWFGFQGSITFPISSSPAGTSGWPVVGRKSRSGHPPASNIHPRGPHLTARWS